MLYELVEERPNFIPNMELSVPNFLSLALSVNLHTFFRFHECDWIREENIYFFISN